MNLKPMRTIILVPLTIAGKFVKYKQIGMLEFVDVKIGDVFYFDKRGDLTTPLSQVKQRKVLTVGYNIKDRANVVELEPQDFKSKEDLERF